MKIYLVRHGQTQANANHISQGYLNSQLTPLGIKQAKKTAERLKAIKITHAYSSDLDRCTKTAKEILKHHPKINLVKTEKIREQAKGIFEGKPCDEFKKAVKHSSLPYEDYKPKYGENLRECWKRMIEFFENLKKEHDKDHLVLIVSHGGPICCLLAYLHGDVIENTKKYSTKGNTAISIINIKGNGEFNFELVNCLQHLDY